jgi:hypothetical protein
VSQDGIEQANGQAKPNGMLYHYTDQAGLFGIPQSGEIWATHFRFLNDLSERQGALDLFLQIDRMLAGDSQMSPAYWEAVRESLKILGQLVDAYFVSFSEDDPASDLSGDRLSQWRGYALSRQGFSLGFDAESLRSSADRLTQELKLATLLLPCVYDNESKESAAIEIIRKHSDALAQIANERVKMKTLESERMIDNPNWKREFKELQSSFLAFSSSFKHFGFQEENEWRFVAYFVSGVSNIGSVHFRDGAFGRTPYIELPLRLKGQHSPLRRIVVGPSPNKEQIAVSLRLELTKMGITGIEVVPSKIPYRNW